MSSAPIRYGLVGCGRSAARHATVLAQLDEARLVAVTDRHPERAGTLAAMHGARACPDLDALLSQELDLVLVTTSSPSHAAVARAAVAAGRAVLVEKPIDVDAEAAAGLVEAAREAQLLLSVVSQHRFHDDVDWLRRTLVGGQLGRPLLASVQSHWRRDQAYYDTRGHGRADPGEGGVLLNQSVHALDLLCWLLGEPGPPQGQLATLTHDIHVEDTAVLSMRFASGCLASFTGTTSGLPQQALRLELRCEHGTVVLRGGRVTQLHLAEGLDLPPPPSRRPDATTPDALEPFRRQHRDVCAALREGRPPLVTGAEGLAVLRFILAALSLPQHPHPSSSTRSSQETVP